MAGEIPESFAFDQIWVVEANYAADAAERRKAVRAEHLARVAKLREAGTIIEVGGFADMSGSLILIRVPGEEEALAIARADVYFRSGVWTGFRIRALHRLVRADELGSD
jgi:uncharacterized protein YciI